MKSVLFTLITAAPAFAAPAGVRAQESGGEGSGGAIALRQLETIEQPAAAGTAVIASGCFGSDVKVCGERVYIAARGQNAQYVAYYRMGADGSLEFAGKVDTPDGTANNNMFGYYIAASHGYLAVATNKGKVYVYPIKEDGQFADPYLVTMTATLPSGMSLDGDVLMYAGKGQVEFFRLGPSSATSLFARDAGDVNSNLGEIKVQGNIAAYNDRGSKKVVIMELITTEVELPECAGNNFALEIGDGHVFTADRGAATVYDITKNDGTWRVSQTIKSPQANTTFGNDLAYGDGKLLSTCNWTSQDLTKDLPATYNGNSYVYELADGKWEAKYVIESSRETYSLGHICAMAGNNIYIANYNHNAKANNGGAVFRYNLTKTAGGDGIDDNLRSDMNNDLNNTSSAAASGGALYDLQGRRVLGKPAAGLYLRNGKAVLVK